MMREKVIYVTGTKNKLRLTEKNSRRNRRTFRGKKARLHELEKKDYAIMWTIKDNTDTQFLVKCAN